jgi:alkylation response protein AidB-like acyl-CoA dehydrogenase
MENYLSYRNLRFVLHEMLDATGVNRFAYYADYDRDAYDMAIDAAKQIADTTMFPFYRDMDVKKAVYTEGSVKVHPQLKKIIMAVAEGGWIAGNAPNEVGGLQMPQTLVSAGLLSFYAANVNACYPFLTQGAANLILSFGSEALKETYLPPMYSGEWQGTMALTEPNAGSSLSDLVTTAEPTETEGVYKIVGQKIYISGGDHDAVDNVVHLLIGRIKGAPAGTKGISLFVVPKLRPEGGELVSNNVTTAGIFDKMGQKGYIAATLMYGEQGDCHGYLVGQPNKGLSYMFQMMNEARIGTGLVAAGAASAAYYASLKYANERPQGRKPSSKNPLDPPILIVEHADIRRMLLFQKAVAEGSIALLMYCSHLADVAHQAEGEEKTNAHLLQELLTPIAKSYPSEMGIHSVNAGMQVLGGAGYCADFPLELISRDIRVNAIYEGTTTIHGLDLVGRKLTMSNGLAAELFGNELVTSITEGSNLGRTKLYAYQLSETAKQLKSITAKVYANARETSPEIMLADATLFLDYFSTVTIAWMWLKQGIVAAKAVENATDLTEDDAIFYESKLATMRYFFEYELPKTKALEIQLLNFDKLTIEMDTAILV